MNANTKPFLSIIIPAYNEEKYLNACLASIYSQKTTKPFEVIVVDNNSRDATARVVSVWQKAKLISELRPGATVTRNTGAKNARAEILYFFDADCRLPEGGLEKIIQAFSKNSLGLLLSGPYIYDLDGWFPKIATDNLFYFSFYHNLVKLFFGIYQFPGGNFAITKKLFDEVNGFDETICNQEIILPDDLDLAIRLHNRKATQGVFSREYAVFSSFRRVNRSPIRHTLIRFFSSLQLLLNKKKIN